MTATQDRSARRAYIRAAHPDRGGDPAAFVAGLARFDPPADVADTARPTVYRSRTPSRLVVQATRTLRRRIAGQPPRRLQ